jgi:hypothetical protein
VYITVRAADLIGAMPGSPSPQLSLKAPYASPKTSQLHGPSSSRSPPERIPSAASSRTSTSLPGTPASATLGSRKPLKQIENPFATQQPEVVASAAFIELDPAPQTQKGTTVVASSVGAPQPLTMAAGASPASITLSGPPPCRPESGATPCPAGAASSGLRSGRLSSGRTTPHAPVLEVGPGKISPVPLAAAGVVNPRPLILRHVGRSPSPPPGDGEPLLELPEVVTSAAASPAALALLRCPVAAGSSDSAPCGLSWSGVLPLSLRPNITAASTPSVLPSDFWPIEGCHQGLPPDPTPTVPASRESFAPETETNCGFSSDGKNSSAKNSVAATRRSSSNASASDTRIAAYNAKKKADEQRLKDEERKKYERKDPLAAKRLEFEKKRNELYAWNTQLREAARSRWQTQEAGAGAAKGAGGSSMQLLQEAFDGV